MEKAQRREGGRDGTAHAQFLILNSSTQNIIPSLQGELGEHAEMPGCYAHGAPSSQKDAPGEGMTAPSAQFLGTNCAPSMKPKVLCDPPTEPPRQREGDDGVSSCCCPEEGAQKSEAALLHE